MEIRSATILRLRDALVESGRRSSPISSSAYRTLFTQGLLSKVENEAVARVAAPAEAMFLVIAADQKVTDTEFMALRGAIRGLAGEALSDELVHLMMENFAQLLTDDGLDKRLSTIANALDTAEALTTFSLAAAVALTDEGATPDEHLVIKKMRTAFALTDEQVGEILGELAQDGA